MRQSRLIILVIIGFAVVFIIWRVGFYIPEAERAERAVETKAGAEPEMSSEVQKPGDANESKMAVDVNEPRRVAEVNEPNELFASLEGKLRGPFRSRRASDGRRPPDGRRGFGGVRGFERRDPNDPNVRWEALNLKDVQMKDIIAKLAEWTGKVIIPADELMEQKVTIYSAQRLPRETALLMIYAALRAKGFVAEHTENMIYIKPMEEARLGSVPTIAAEQPLAGLENKNQVVQKFFKLVNYSPTQMSNIILPLIGEYGYVSADENTGNLLVIDTVENLMRIERIIVQFDVPESEQTVTGIFEIRYGDPAEIVQVLEMLLTDERGRSLGRGIPSSQFRGGFGGRGGLSSFGSRGPAGARGSSEKGAAAKAAKKTVKGKMAATSVAVGASQTPIVLIPEPRRKWIIARASAEDMKRIGEWIEKLDRQEPVPSEYETIQITYADVSEVAARLNEALQDMPGTELKASVLVQPLIQARQIMVFGRKDLREMVKKLIEEIDIPAGEFETKVFKLKHADPEQIKENIDNLYGESDPSGRYDYYYYRYGRSQLSPAETVKVIVFSTMQQVTVIASAENMIKITEQIAEWDVPLDVEQVKPRIIVLHNSDPVQMAELLRTLFSEEQAGRMSFWDLYFGRGGEKAKIVGPLYGQLTFEEVPGTKKIIVISKIPEAYDVIEELVRELDKQEMAEVPKVVTLNYADPEDLAERLNAMFNEPGTTATIRYAEQGLSAYSMEETDEQSSSDKEEGTTQGQYTPWWAKARSTAGEEMPISNVIGRIRFIPDPRSKAILVLAPPEFMENIEEMIKELDYRGLQVMIKAIIVEVDHKDVTSLGLQLASSESTFGTLAEDAITALTRLTHLETLGQFTFNTSSDVTLLIDFLVKKIDAKILNQQTLWTKDNEEAEFFKGDKVAFITGEQTSAEGKGITQSYEFQRVGMTLRARPSITPEKNVDMIINVILAQLTSELINTQPVRTEMETTTNLIVQDGQTIMLGGILFQKDSVIERKLPLLGDVPLVGGLFRHNETIVANNELIVFITPYVIDEPGKMLPETIEQMERPKEKLESIREQLQGAIEG